MRSRWIFLFILSISLVGFHLISCSNNQSGNSTSGTTGSPTGGGGTATLSFSKAVNFDAGKTPEAVALADFNEDGNLDMVVAIDDLVANTGNNANLLLGDGKGGFGAPQPLKITTTGTTSLGVVAGDLNNDKHADAAILSGGTQLFVLRGKGNGSFDFDPVNDDHKVGDGGGLSPRGLAMGDMKGDGSPNDLATPNGNDNSVSALGNTTNSGSFGISTGLDPLHLNNPRHVAIGDLNGDGKADVAVVNFQGNNVAVYFADSGGSGKISSPQNYTVGTAPLGVAMGDFNGDGKLDIVTANSQNSETAGVSVLLNDGTGKFGAASSFPAVHDTSSVVVADFNKDGIQDLAVGNAFGAGGAPPGQVGVYLGKGDGTFQSAMMVDVGPNDPQPRFVTAADVNQDGKIDLITANKNLDNVSVILNSTP